jgi:hypothetical protein
MSRAAVSRFGSDHGFSAVEVLLVATMLVTLAAFAGGAFLAANTTIQGDADLRVLYGQIKYAREAAINQRRAVEVQFAPPNVIRVVRRNVPNGTTVLATTYLEHHTIFTLFESIPDTPDGFGRTAPIAFSGAASYMFTSDNMFTDAAGTPVNGTVFIGQIDKPTSARAVTIFGPTAMIRTYRWNGAAWTR